jgi:hypothetical protein
MRAPKVEVTLDPVDACKSVVLVNGKRAAFTFEAVSCRVIFMTERYVVKVVDPNANDAGYSDLNPRAQNRCEVRTWKRISKSDDRARFAEMLCWDPKYTWVCQERVRTSRRATTQERNFLEEVAARYNVGDIHRGNIGRRKGQPVILDYGCKG